MRAHATALVLALTTTLLAQDAPTFDLLLRGGSVVDGTRRPGVVADVAVRGGRIVALGDLRGATATRTIDCTDLVVAPGFVDVHVHADSEVARNPQCGNFLQMGVTTIVTGNCGSSVRDLAAHFARIEAGGVGVNYGSLVGLGTVRTAVMGTEQRDPTAEELARMEQLVDEGMRHGAFGVSTGLIYVPGTYASTAEITALAKVAARHGGLYASHMRNENNDVLAAVAEALQVGRDAGIHVQVSHVKNTGRPNWGRSREVLDALRAARRSGQSVTADQYAYDASSTSLDVLFPSAELAIGRKEFAARLRDDATFRAAMKQALHATMDRVGFGDLRYARIASAPGNSGLAGLTIAEAAARVKGADDRDAQAEMAMDLFAASAGERVGMVYHVMSEEDVATFLAEDWIAIASDAGLRLPSADKPHPRGSGNNPRVLGRYVRERGVLDLPLAVHKMTRLPAQVFGIAERGEVRVGWHADLAVFDPATVLDQATYQDPLLPPVGIPYVIVNGTVAVDQGTLAPGRAGRVLRRNG